MSEETEKTDKQKIAILERKIYELKSEMIHNYHFATQTIGKFSSDQNTGSSVIIELSYLGGKTKLDPVAIRDGLSPETIDALKKDLKRSYAKAIEFTP